MKDLGSLHTSICLDFLKNVNFISQFMHSPMETHYKVVKHILLHLKGTADLGLKILVPIGILIGLQKKQHTISQYS